MAIKAITFVDIKKLNDAQRVSLKQAEAELNRLKAENNGFLPPEQDSRLRQIVAELALTVVDPIYRTLDAGLDTLTPGKVGDHTNGKLPSSAAAPATKLTAAERRLAAVYGITRREGRLDTTDPDFAPAIPVALGEYSSRKALYDRILDVFIADGDIFQNGEFDTKDWVSVARLLHEAGTDAGDSLLPLKVRTTLAKVAGASEGTPTSALDINLPDLEAKVDEEVVEDNLLAMQSLYFSMALEDMKLFYARDLALEQWQLGMVVVGRGGAGDRFYDMWRKTPFRLSELERHSLYSRGFGFPGGDSLRGTPNRDFGTLWVRFLSAVSAFTRRSEVDNLLRANIPAAISQEQVRQSGRDLAHNLSVHGYGIAYFAAKELQQEIDEILGLLSDPEVLRAYGARDIYQVIEQIVLFSGGQVENTFQKRTMAHAGAVIIRWLANSEAKLRGNSLQRVLDENLIANPLPQPANHKPTKDPTDYDLVTAVRQWLAVNGVQDQFIEQNAQAMEPPRMPTRPIQIPSIARDVLDSVGVSASYSAGNGGGNGNGALRRYNGARA
jgi:hypothetical protein